MAKPQVALWVSFWSFEWMLGQRNHVQRAKFRIWIKKELGMDGREVGRGKRGTKIVIRV